MSYIDLFDHEHVGHFAGLPIYRPLEKITPQEEIHREFPAEVTNLVLGGGGYLEHPAMVFTDLDYIAACFIADWLDFYVDNQRDTYNEEDINGWSAIIHGFLNLEGQLNSFKCYQWSIRHYSDFYRDCQSTVMRSPFVETAQRNNFEFWLLSNIGELVVFSYPELISNQKIRTVAQHVDRALYGNVSILPAGYPDDFLGRLLVNGEPKQGHKAFYVAKNPNVNVAD